ncbi:LysM peptidoglycan-binding domain-containing protein [Flavobacterium enshiense]|nr:LysM peptidoglycan-binding domain-containing protein [Flavobacterium enshiense]
MTKVFSLIFGICSMAVMAQETVEQEVAITSAPKLSYLDSIKATFAHHEAGKHIDEMWLKELNNQELFDEMQAAVTQGTAGEAISYNLSTDLLKERLKKLDEKTPFHVEYNSTIENVIKSFLKNRPRAFERLMALSEYYFPMFEKSLEKYDLPLEIKYLAIVESALNPLAKSRVGASGLWQFMYETGKQYNLEVNSYVDERYDPLKATEAACQYFTNMYKIFNDWDLVLASYNTGPGNIAKAIRRSGGQTNYWNIRKFMHPETQGYLPAFYATMYVYEYRKEHGIVPKRASVTYFETDTVMVKKQMTFKQIADLLDMPEEQLRFLNPIYKRNVVPFVSDKAHFIRLPKDKLAIFTSNEDKVYAYVDYEESKREKQQFKVKKPRTIVSDSIQTAVASNNNAPDSEDEEEVAMKSVKKTKIKYYTVKRGDNLSEIAENNNVSTDELKKWNKLKKSSVNAGQKLKIQYETTVAVADKTALRKKKADTLKVADPVVKTSEPAIAVVANEKVYTVLQGDNLTKIAAKNNVTAAQLKEWNNLNDEGIRAGQELKIQASDDAVASVEKVVAKENKKSVKEKKLQEERLYVVQKGDSLLRISKKMGTTVAEIKKLNNIKGDGDDIRPGMKLKING